MAITAISPYSDGDTVTGANLSQLPMDRTAWQNSSSTDTIAAGSYASIDTSGGAVTITLPGSPANGDKVGFLDATGSFATNNLTIARNGNNIMGLAEDLTVSTNYASFILTWISALSDWRIVAR